MTAETKARARRGRVGPAYRPELRGHRQSQCRWPSGWLLVALLAVSGCGRPAAPPTPRTPDTLAREYVRLVLALGERDPDSLDFATAPEAVKRQVHAEYPTLDAIGRQAEALRAEQASSQPAPAGDPERAAFLRLQLQALAARVAMLRGHTLPFDEEAWQLFATVELPERADAEAGRAALRARVLALLPASHARKPASGAERYAEYDRRFQVPPERLATVMQAALGACRRQTLLYMSLPPGESVELRFVRNQPWSAFSRYRGGGHSTILLNLDLPLTVDDVLELACHEGYPGHHVFNTLRDAALVAGKGWPEAQVQPTFSPQSFVSEAAAAYAPRMAFTPAERTEVERTLLFPLAGLAPVEAGRYGTISTLVRALASAEPAIARQYLDGNVEFVRAGALLEREALMAHPEATLLYLNEYRSYMLAYTDGPQRIETYLGAARENEPAEAERRRRWARYRGLMTHLVFTLPTPKNLSKYFPRSGCLLMLEGCTRVI